MESERSPRGSGPPCTARIAPYGVRRPGRESRLPLLRGQPPRATEQRRWPHPWGYDSVDDTWRAHRRAGATRARGWLSRPRTRTGVLRSAIDARRRKNALRVAELYAAGEAEGAARHVFWSALLKGSGAAERVEEAGTKGSLSAITHRRASRGRRTAISSVGSRLPALMNATRGATAGREEAARGAARTSPTP